MAEASGERPRLRVDIYTDGACSGNPGPGGWGAILRAGEHEKELFGSANPTTNNRMELMGAIAGLEALKRPSEVQIGHATEADLRDGLKVLATQGVDAIVQAGTDLALADLAGEGERWLGIPVIAINVATYWSALRANGITDRIGGFGSLLAEH